MGYCPTSVSIYTPLPPQNIDLLRVSIYPSPSAAADIGYGILHHVSIYVSPFPARNIGYGGYGIWPRVSFYLAPHAAADVGYRILPH